jgi:NAD(P)-dependent dehydrogenase (short-subunit alcohol dehydrogenase family)
MTKRVALVTGGSRGLGFETAGQLGRLGYALIIASRDGAQLTTAARTLSERGHEVSYHTLDQSSRRSVATFVAWVKKQKHAIDALVNCAGVLLESDNAHDSNRTNGTSVLNASETAVLQTIAINTIGPWRLVRALAGLLAQNARIVNVSSGMGAISEMGSGYFGYRVSKAGLNVLTRTLAYELRPRGIAVNSVCPGWVKTDMGGPGATRDVSQGAAGIVWAATLPPGGPTGGFFRDGKQIAW